MQRHIAPEYLLGRNPEDACLGRGTRGPLKRWLLAPCPPPPAPLADPPSILETVCRNHFHVCSLGTIFDSNSPIESGDSESVQTFWRGDELQADSQATVTMESEPRASAASLQTLAREPGQLATTAQQTDISCANDSAILGDLNTIDQQNDQIGDPPLINRANLPRRTGQVSILASVCALLLTTQRQAQQSSAKRVDSVEPETICRICFGGESAERLVQPCSCRGTIAAVHRACLERWLLQSATSHCELCRYHYAVTRTHKWSLVRSVAEWARSGRGRALAVDVWRGAVLGAASVLGTSRALQACERVLRAGAHHGGSTALVANVTSSVLIGLIGALNGLLTTWMLLKLQEHQLSWRAWRQSTLHVRVTLSLHAHAHAARAAAAPSDATVTAEGAEEGEELVADPSLASLPRSLN